MIQPRRFGPQTWGTLSGLLLGFAAMLWLTVYLLTGDGATNRVLLVSLLFLLPILGIGALLGWLAGVVLERVGRGAA